MDARIRPAIAALLLSAGTGAWVLVQSSCGGGAPSVAKAGAAPDHSSACQTATAELKHVYDQLKSCLTDADCNYVEGFYKTIPRDETGMFITTQDCKSVTPFLVVANGPALEARRQELESL